MNAAIKNQESVRTLLKLYNEQRAENGLAAVDEIDDQELLAKIAARKIVQRANSKKYQDRQREKAMSGDTEAARRLQWGKPRIEALKEWVRQGKIGTFQDDNKHRKLRGLRRQARTPIQEPAVSDEPELSGEMEVDDTEVSRGMQVDDPEVSREMQVDDNNLGEEAAPSMEGEQNALSVEAAAAMPVDGQTEVQDWLIGEGEFDEWDNEEWYFMQ